MIHVIMHVSISIETQHYTSGYTYKMNITQVKKKKKFFFAHIFCNKNASVADQELFERYIKV